MADALAVDVRGSIQWLFQEGLDLSTVVDSSKLEFSASLADGTGADQADKVWHDERTIAAASNDELDLNMLTTTIFGSTVTINLAKVKAILVVNLSTNAGDELEVGGAATNPFTGPFNGVASAVVEVGPDSALLLCNKKDGWPVTNGSSDTLRIRNPNAAAVSYRIVIVGTSA